MNTPEKIKKGLECCFSPDGCEACPYHGDYIECFADKLKDDIVAYIRQLESTVSEKEKVIAELLEKIEQLKRERDAAVNDLSTGLRCNACKKFFKNNNNVGCSGGLYCIPFRFEWRGVCPENAEVQKNACKEV